MPFGAILRNPRVDGPAGGGSDMEQVSLKAFYVDEGTIYAAVDAEQAAVLFEQDTGVACDEPDYPREIGANELEAAVPDFDEDERPTGSSSCIRAWLLEATAPGMLAASLR